MGVKVYVVVAVVFKAGDHTPTYPLVEVVGRAAIVVPEQTGFTAENVGRIFGFTVIVSVVGMTHNPELEGVNV